MRLFYWGHDGGKDSTVKGFWLIEIKWLFSIVLLRFDGKSREAWHTHAFNCLSLVLKGQLIEHCFYGAHPLYYNPFNLVYTRRTTYHKVDSVGRSWVLSFRGPWAKTWKEFDPETNIEVTLTHGRKVINNEDPC